ncbi:hypothetical protein MGY77_000208 [Enterococcus faecalis]|uniref:hypothetical protein n=1 Tax=Enterococcus faecalis TaxID=1351 RepID=UPI0025B17A57|nr:hypothetical protein [Enterococcus faecalis]EIP8061576.1 hypothetical protein [Enterococcus faecalis]EIW9706782.1 hypothetical protein [Enterococcus faecalis]EKZ0109386.1 hypothetical protein [Enterococcus faecalis]MDN3200301.1 hypothetical protein [Enterococcus faecalis]
MKKAKFCMLGAALILGSTPIVTAGTNAYANEGTPEQQTSLWDIEDETNPIYDSKTSNDNLPENVTLEYTEEGPVVTVYEEGTAQRNRIARAAVYRWGGWEYTNIAISTGVLAGAINTGLSVGVGFVAGTIGLPAFAVGGLLTASGWTKLGNAPGAAVAKQWDKNGNGWVGFYYQRGYDAAGRVVATRYKTE